MHCFRELQNNRIEYINTDEYTFDGTRWAVRLFVRDLYSDTTVDSGINQLHNPQEDLYDNSYLCCLQLPNALIREHDYDEFSTTYEILTSSLYYLRFRYVENSSHSSWTRAEQLTKGSPLWNALTHGYWDFGMVLDFSWRELLGDNNDTARSTGTV